MKKTIFGLFFSDRYPIKYAKFGQFLRLFVGFLHFLIIIFKSLRILGKSYILTEIWYKHTTTYNISSKQYSFFYDFCLFWPDFCEKYPKFTIIYRILADFTQILRFFCKNLAKKEENKKTIFRAYVVVCLYQISANIYDFPKILWNWKLKIY